MALQESNDNSRTGHHCRDCGLFFESSKSLEVHLQYHKENLLTKWASQANASVDSSRTDSENNNVKSRREFQSLVAAPADSTDMKPVLPTGPGRPGSNSSYPPTSSPFTHPHTPASYSSAPSPYQNDVQRFSPSNNPGPSPSSTSFGYANGTAEPYQLPFNSYAAGGNLRSPRSQQQQQQQQQQPPPPPVDPAQQFFPEAPQEPPYVMGGGGGGGGGGGAGDFPPGAPVHRSGSPSSSSTFRFNAFAKTCYPLDKNNGVSSSSPNSFRPQTPLQCEKCGFVCDSQAMLSDHAKTSHAPSPMGYGHGSAGFQATDAFFRPDAAKQEAVQDSPDILDLDSQQKVFRSPEEDSGAAAPAANPHSVSAMLTPWSNGAKAQYPQAQPYLVSSTNPPQNYPPPPPPPPQNGPIPTPGFQSRNFPSESYPQQSNVPNQSINNNQIPNSASPKLTNPANSLGHSGMGAAKGDSWKSNEARRPKTYNCSACNKWFTSSGHLKRHYNTTLHKNAVKQSGQPDPATLPISSHHHPNRDPNYIHSSKTPPGMSNPPPNLSVATKAKKAKSISPQGDANTPSPALSNANEGDSSRSNDNLYDRMYDGRNGSLSNGSYDRPVQHGFGNGGGGGGGGGGFEMIQASGTSAFDRTTPGGGPGGFADQRTPPSFDQRATPQGFDRPQGFDGRSAGEFDVRGQNGYALQDLNRPGSNPDLPAGQNYEYYRYDRLPLHNQQNSTNQVSAQSPNFQAGPSVSPSGGLPICPPSHPSLRTPNHTNTFMGENILMAANELPSQPPDQPTTLHYINSPTITGNEARQHAPLPSFSNFQTSIFQQGFPSASPFAKGFYSADCHEYAYVKSEPADPSPDKPVYPHEHHHHQPQQQQQPQHHQQQQHHHQHHHQQHQQQHHHHHHQHHPHDYLPEGVEDADRTDPAKDDGYGLSYEAKRQMDLLNIKIELVDTFSENSDSQMPPSPVEFPTSTNLELSEPARRGARKRQAKRKPEESSNVVTSTGSPQPSAKKAVIKCEECDKYFNRICYLTQHNKSFHSGEKPFKCERCGKRFHSELRAKDHSKKHGGEKPYKCEMCPKSFNHKTDLRRHLCLHSGAKPYVCEHCGKGFIRKDHMLKHVDTHRNGKRKFVGKPADDLLAAKAKVDAG